jgi:hypothetical protein
MLEAHHRKALFFMGLGLFFLFFLIGMAFGQQKAMQKINVNISNNAQKSPKNIISLMLSKTQFYQLKI